VRYESAHGGALLGACRLSSSSALRKEMLCGARSVPGGVKWTRHPDYTFCLSTNCQRTDMRRHQSHPHPIHVLYKIHNCLTRWNRGMSQWTDAVRCQVGVFMSGIACCVCSGLVRLLADLADVCSRFSSKAALARRESLLAESIRTQQRPEAVCMCKCKFRRWTTITKSRHDFVAVWS